MKTSGGAAFGVLLVSLALAGCGPAASGSAAGDEQPPATIVEVPGSDIPSIMVNDESVDRIGIATAVVQAAGAAIVGPAKTKRGPSPVAIPYPAVVYLSDGSTWAFAPGSPQTYRRTPITVADIRGDQAILSSGPVVGSEVVTVGAPELLGVELNINGEN